MPPGGIPQVARSGPSGASTPVSRHQAHGRGLGASALGARGLLGHDGLALRVLVRPGNPACAAALSAPCPSRLRGGTRLQRCGQPLDSAAKPGERKVESPHQAAGSDERDRPGRASGPRPWCRLITERHTLQSARAANIIEANGRPMRFLSAVSGATARAGLGGTAGPDGRHVLHVRPRRVAGAAGARSDQLLEAGRPGRARRVLRARHRTHPGVLPDHRTWRSLFRTPPPRRPVRSRWSASHPKRTSAPPA